MSKLIVAQRYAKALYERAEETHQIEAVDEGMALLHEVLQTSPALVKVLRVPIIPRERKVAVFEALLHDRVPPLVLGLIRLVIRKRREQLLPDIVQAYLRLRDEMRGIVDAEAWTAVEVSSEEVKRIEEALSTFLQAQVRLQVEAKPEILGGVVVRVQDRVYDRSVRHQLEVLRTRLAGQEINQ